MNRSIVFTWLFLVVSLASAQVPPGMMGVAGGTGGGVTVGDAVSGGTASRLLFNDASGLVSTASPALGAGLALNPGPLTVSSCDPATTGDADGCSVVDMAATAASGDKARVTRFNGTTVHSIDRDGNQVNAGTLRVDGNADFRGDLSNDDVSATCAGYGAGKLCINDAQGFIVNFAGANRTTGPTSIQLMHIGGGVSGIGFAYNLDTNNQAITSDADDLTFWGDGDSDFIFQPGNSTSITFEDFGEVRIHRNATGGVTGTDCDSDAEVGRLRRYSKDANNITLCWCQKRAGSYEWAAGPLGGDCT